MMNDPIEYEEKQKYKRVWADPRYRKVSPGEVSGVDRFLDGFPDAEGTVIDMGCGTGRAAALLMKVEGLNVIPLDHVRNCIDSDLREQLEPVFFKACLWKLPGSLQKAEHVFCCDVMEHIPEEKVEQVLRNIAAKCTVGGLFQISTAKDSMGPKIIGEHLHLTIRTAKWWKEQLEQFFTIRSEEISDKEASFVVDIDTTNTQGVSENG